MRARVGAEQDVFLDAFSKYSTIAHACREAGIGRATHYRWMAADPEYAERRARC